MLSRRGVLAAREGDLGQDAVGLGGGGVEPHHLLGLLLGALVASLGEQALRRDEAQLGVVGAAGERVVADLQRVRIPFGAEELLGALDRGLRLPVCPVHVAPLLASAGRTG